MTFGHPVEGSQLAALHQCPSAYVLHQVLPPAATTPTPLCETIVRLQGAVLAGPQARDREGDALQQATSTLSMYKPGHCFS
jgi:hypothetical protein